MRHVAVLCGIVLILAFRADAQVSSGTSLLLGSPMPAFAFASPAAAPSQPRRGANASALAASAPDPAPQGVYGVLQNYNWQAYAGYTHFTFYEIPGVTSNLNGFNMSLVFLPPRRDTLAPMGSLRLRSLQRRGSIPRWRSEWGERATVLDAGRGIELWAMAWSVGRISAPDGISEARTHSLSRWAAESISTPRHGRLGYRAQVDMVGTRFFGTHQYNPKISLGHRLQILAGFQATSVRRAHRSLSGFPSELIADLAKEFVAALRVLRALDTLGRAAIHDAQDPAPLFDVSATITSTGFAVAQKSSRPRSSRGRGSSRLMGYALRISRTNDVSCADRLGIRHGRAPQLFVIGFHAHQAWPRRFVECDRELGSRHRVHHNFVNIFRRFDEVRMPEDQICVLREFPCRR